MPTDTWKEHKYMQAKTDSHTQAPKNPAGFGSHALTSGSQSKGFCSAAHNSTTDPPAPLVNFALSLLELKKSAVLFGRKEEEEKGGPGSQATICVTTKSPSVHAGWGCARVSVCICKRAQRVTLYSTTAYKKRREQGFYGLRRKHRPMLQAK